MKTKTSNESANKEISLSGSAGCPGIAIGKVSLYRRSRPTVSNNLIEDGQIAEEVQRFQEARKKADKELKDLLDGQRDDDTKTLIRTQIEIIKDPELCKRIEFQITDNNRSADSAIQHAFESYLKVIRQNHEGASLERSVDIADVRDRLIQILHNHTDEIAGGRIMVARELSPREIISFSSHDIKGIVTDRGGITSHVTIIARSMNIPTVVGLKNATDVINSDDEVIVDGRNGEVIVNPQPETREKYQMLMEQQVEPETDFESVCEQNNRTSDDKPFVLRANIEFAEELSTVKKYRAEGIGLLRTESIYLQRDHFEDQKHQEAFYESILEITDPHPVTIRLFDAGGDKFFEEGQAEQNPFLGWRGIRMLLDEKEMLQNQLRAILSTAAKFKGRVRILVPMISTLDELLEVKEMMRRVQHELKEQGVSIDEKVPLGIMVEVPSVALQIENFARHSDFMSIGTNDLTQYLLAVDRGNERISKLYNQRHPVIWQMIKRVAVAAKENEIPLSVCGELASDPLAACCLLGLGINELSMNPIVLPSVKEVLCTHSLTEMRELSEKVLASKSVAEINQIFSNWKEKPNT